MSYNVPILFITYKRFRTASLVFEQIKKIKPKKLYFANNYPENKKEINSVKKVQHLLNQVNWRCKIIKIFQKKHLPVSKSIPTAIDYFFKHEKEGIILEDDCLPSQDFFYFCKLMLNKYRNNKNINAICGSRFIRNGKSMYFSKYNHAWGWATWKRSWKNFDPKIKFWNKWKNSDDWNKFHNNTLEKNYWSKIFNLTHKGKINTWDYAWTATAWYNKQLSVIPPVNLISNIGFGPDATWTVQSKYSNINKLAKLKKKILIKKVSQNKINDLKVFNNHFNKNNHLKNSKIIRHLKTLIIDPKTFLLKIKREFKHAKKNY